MKPREFWIKFKIGDEKPAHQIVEVSMNKLDKAIHVIEKSAYEYERTVNERVFEQLGNMSEEIETLKAKLKKANEEIADLKASIENSEMGL